jgi:hypothetical protein
MKILDFEQFVLNEIYAEELENAAEPRRKHRSNRIIVNYTGIKQRSSKSRIKTVCFEATDPETTNEPKIVKIQIPDYRSISRLKKNISTPEKLQMSIEAGNIKTSCSCLDWKYKGYKYMGYMLDYGIYPESIEPKITNPNFEGSICKHILATIKHISEFYDKIAEDIESYGHKRVEYEKKRKSKKKP